MTIFNVAVKVVDLIEADSAEEAIDVLRKRLHIHGFEPHDEGDDAFESEDQEQSQ